MKIKTYSMGVKFEGAISEDSPTTEAIAEALEKKIKEHIEHFEREAFLQGAGLGGFEVVFTLRDWAILEFKATPPVIVHRCGGSNTGTMTDRYRCSRCHRKPPTEIISTYKMLYLRNP
jgi:hypothetical protein